MLNTRSQSFLLFLAAAGLHFSESDLCFHRCQVCFTSNTCEMCQEGYRLGAGGTTCESCAFGCVNCDRAGRYKCDRCRRGYGVVPTSEQCAPCPDDCASCKYNDQCERCKAYYTLKNGSCEKTCGADCKNCEVAAAGFCDECNSGFALKGNTCSACADNCDYCLFNGPGLCDIVGCRDGYKFDQKDKMCYSSSAPDGVAKTCGPNCKNCEVAGAGSCDECNQGYTVKVGRCLACAGNCDYCQASGAGLCDIAGCRDGYEFDSRDKLCYISAAPDGAASTLAMSILSVVVKYLL